MKRKYIYFLCPALALCLFLFIHSANPAKDTDIEALLSQMTLEEKVGQMTNLTLSTIAREEENNLILEMPKVKDAIKAHNIGSFQNVVSHAYSVETWHTIINQIQDVSMKETRMKIPFLYCIDAVHGANYSLNSTLFPHNLGLAATRNPELVKKCAEITAKEVRASGIRYNFSPVLDVGRQPLWPRFAETFGEDVYLTKVMGVASVKGYEGADLKSINSVASCMKHYVGYSVPDNGRDRASANIPEIMLREYFLPSFKAAIDAKSHTLMVNSAEVNGVPVHASKYLLTDILRGELGYKGVVISDWEDVKKLHERHRVAESYKEAVRLSVDAGIDMCIVPMDFKFYEYLIELVKEGKISEDRINQSVRRILQLKKDLGLFEKPYVEKEALKNFGLAEYKTVALDAARESVTLLKNTNQTLPIAKSKKVFVIGPGSVSLTTLNGAWSYTWQGKESKYFPQGERTIDSAIRSEIGDENFLYYKDFDYKDSTFNVEEIRKATEVADYIVLCLGEDAYAETPGNIKDLNLAANQMRLAKGVCWAGKLNKAPVILVLTSGRPRIIRELEPEVSAILFAYWPGSQGANAVGDILFGDYNPNGKLPFTYPKFPGDIYPYDHKQLDDAVEETVPEYKFYYKFDPQWEFGHGLSYTTFEYSNLTVTPDKMTTSGSVKVSVTVKNTGKFAGKESVELYTRDVYASVTPSVKRLREFKKINLEPGASQVVDFQLSKDDVAFVGQNMKWVTEVGEFEVMVGGLKGKFVYQ